MLSPPKHWITPKQRRSDGMLLSFAKHTRQTGRQKVTVRPRFGTSFDCPNVPFGAEIYLNPISTKDKCRVHQCGTKMLPGRFMGYSLTSGEGWTGDLIIVDWHDVETIVASEVHVKRFKSKEVGIKKLQVRREGHAQRQTSPERREIRRGERTLNFGRGEV